MKKNIGLLFTMLAATAMTAATVCAKELVINDKTTGIDTVIQDGVELVPVRTTAEELGFDVEWDGENKSVVLSDLPRYVTFSVGTDGYTFARTAPMPLGQAPVIIDDVTYVPVSLFDEILDYDVKDDEKNIYIADKNAEDEVVSDGAIDEVVAEDTDEATEESVSTKVSVTSVSNDTITVNDDERGEVVLAIDENLVITDSEGNEVAFEDIKEGDVLNVVYGDAMTMSIPPVNNPVSVELEK